MEDAEECCYDEEHIQEVLDATKVNFDKFFNSFIGLNGDKKTQNNDDKLSELQAHFGIRASKPKTIAREVIKVHFEERQKQAIEEYKSDKSAYEELLDEETLEEYEDNPNSFKTTALKKECPIIRKTLNSSDRELKKFKESFANANSQELLNTITNLSEFGRDYAGNYNESEYENIADFCGFHVDEFTTEDLTYFGVIGSGIKSLMLYKLYPHMFPYRSQNAIWALWYLTDKETFGCREGSEFLMVDVEKTTTRQNYYYPYDLFCFYAFSIYKMFKKKAKEIGSVLDVSHRYVLVDDFFNYIVSLHEDEISLLRKQDREGGSEYAFA